MHGNGCKCQDHGRVIQKRVGTPHHVPHNAKLCGNVSTYFTTDVVLTENNAPTERFTYPQTLSMRHCMYSFTSFRQYGLKREQKKGEY